MNKLVPAIATLTLAACGGEMPKTAEQMRTEIQVALTNGTAVLRPNVINDPNDDQLTDNEAPIGGGKTAQLQIGSPTELTVADTSTDAADLSLQLTDDGTVVQVEGPGDETTLLQRAAEGSEPPCPTAFSPDKEWPGTLNINLNPNGTKITINPFDCEQ
ncbi:hypothetical protein IPJ72_01505 [Candidatus Peregrinibacteria bacterium]|nr:MAG: hypothetical protein IPJ72_01505 [Candidatus Peregrinibacteria bacterium]